MYLFCKILKMPFASLVQHCAWFSSCWLCCTVWLILLTLETECNMLCLISAPDIRCSQYKTSLSQTFLPSPPSVLFVSWSLGPVTEEQPAGPGHGMTQCVWASKGNGCGSVYNSEVKILMSNHVSSLECMAPSGHNCRSLYWPDIRPLCKP